MFQIPVYSRILDQNRNICQKNEDQPKLKAF